MESDEKSSRKSPKVVHLNLLDNGINYILSLNQKKKTNNGVIILEKILNTINIGTALKYIGLRKKSLKRTTKGLKIFLNFIKMLFFKKNIINSKSVRNLILNINGFNNFLLKYKKNIFKNLILKENNFIEKKVFFLMNLKIDFCKKKTKKIKSIKKRLKKKILKNFIKFLKKN